MNELIYKDDSKSTLDRANNNNNNNKTGANKQALVYIEIAVVLCVKKRMIRERKKSHS